MSKVEVNEIRPQCGTTITLGGAGETVALGACASAAGFGAITWCTTAKTAAFCAAAGSGYLVNTTSTAFTATLPASPTVGDQVSFVDFAGTFDSNALTLGRNSKKIKGACKCATVEADRGAITIIYTGTTQGWITTSQANDGTMAQAEYVTATGGSPATGSIVCTNYKVHTFTSTGPFNVTAAGNPSGSTAIDYMVIAGGGGGGHGTTGCHNNGGGGAGGYRESNGTASGCYTTSPLGTGPCTTAITAAVSDYTITVGGGGAGGASRPVNSTAGTPSVFSTITSAGGGASGKSAGPSRAGLPGGSGGGGASCSSGAGGTGNDPPSTPSQGFPGGAGQDGPTPNISSGGGGGASSVGTDANTPGGVGGNGGAGATTCITGSPVGRAGGGAGGSNSTGGTATDGGGTVPSMAGTANTGGGGASGSAQTDPSTTGGTGGSGVVIVRYKFQQVKDYDRNYRCQRLK